MICYTLLIYYLAVVRNLTGSNPVIEWWFNVHTTSWSLYFCEWQGMWIGTLNQVVDVIQLEVYYFWESHSIVQWFIGQIAIARCWSYQSILFISIPWYSEHLYCLYQVFNLRLWLESFAIFFIIVLQCTCSVYMYLFICQIWHKGYRWGIICIWFIAWDDDFAVCSLHQSFVSWI